MENDLLFPNTASLIRATQMRLKLSIWTTSMNSHLDKHVWNLTFQRLCRTASKCTYFHIQNTRAFWISTKFFTPATLAIISYTILFAKFCLHKILYIRILCTETQISKYSRPESKYISNPQLWRLTCNSLGYRCFTTIIIPFAPQKRVPFHFDPNKILNFKLWCKFILIF